ncbi:unnamed protein product [Arabidopsis halleri]
MLGCVQDRINSSRLMCPHHYRLTMAWSITGVRVWDEKCRIEIVGVDFDRFSDPRIMNQQTRDCTMSTQNQCKGLGSTCDPI